MNAWVNPVDGTDIVPHNFLSSNWGSQKISMGGGQSTTDIIFQTLFWPFLKILLQEVSYFRYFYML